MANESVTSEARRLEKLWAGQFGDAYVQRNAEAGNGRQPFWNALLEKYPAAPILEVGCNLGGNLRQIASKVVPREVYGVDLNETALMRLRSEVPEVNGIWSP